MTRVVSSLRVLALLLKFYEPVITIWSSMTSALWCMLYGLPSRRTSMPFSRKWVYSPPILLNVCDSSNTPLTKTPPSARSSMAWARSSSVRNKPGIEHFPLHPEPIRASDLLSHRRVKNPPRSEFHPHSKPGKGYWLAILNQTDDQRTSFRFPPDNSAPVV